MGPFDSNGANLAWFCAAFGIAAAGALLRIVTSGHAALGTSGSNKVAAVAPELNTTGPYSLVRNPLYLGRILNFTGIAMLSGSWEYGALVFFVCILVYERISVYEEEFLRELRDRLDLNEEKAERIYRDGSSEARNRALSRAESRDQQFIEDRAAAGKFTGRSDGTLENAIDDALAKAAMAIPRLHWFEVIEIAGYVSDGKAGSWHVTLRAGIRSDES